MERFEIAVPMKHWRFYTVQAEDGHEALEKYQAGLAEFDSDDMKTLSTWVELGDKAEVYTTDELRTLVATADGDV